MLRTLVIAFLLFITGCANEEPEIEIRTPRGEPFEMPIDEAGSSAPIRINVMIPQPLQPLERGERFELPLCDLFDETDGGDVVGGGTMLEQGKITSANIEIEINDESLLPKVIETLRAGKAPDDTEISIGEPINQTKLLRDF
ncbi:hypothetical protein LOC69_24300 [Blastopirellula sp. JC733]|nr:hypothetical protein [Blastopirellula sediminis]